MNMNNCPCCSSQLLRHARHSGVYWFCSYCWQEMPDFSSMITGRHHRVQQLERLIDRYTSTPTQKTTELKTLTPSVQYE